MRLLQTNIVRKHLLFITPLNTSLIVYFFLRPIDKISIVNLKYFFLPLMYHRLRNFLCVWCLDFLINVIQKRFEQPDYQTCVALKGAVIQIIK